MGGIVFILIVFVVSVYFGFRIIRSNIESFSKNKSIFYYSILLVNTLATPFAFLFYNLNISRDSIYYLLSVVFVFVIAIAIYHFISLIINNLRLLLKSNIKHDQMPYSIEVYFCIANLVISLINIFFLVMLFWAIG